MMKRGTDLQQHYRLLFGYGTSNTSPARRQSDWKLESASGQLKLTHSNQCFVFLQMAGTGPVTPMFRERIGGAHRPRFSPCCA